MKNKIRILSDGNELEFQKPVIINKLPMLEYKYTKSVTKLGFTVCYSQLELDLLIKNKIAKVL